MRTIPDISELLKPLEFEISHKLIPALTYSRQPTSEERELLSLPARLGGLGITNPVKSAQQEYSCSQLLTKPLTTNIPNQVREYKIDVQQITVIKNDIRATRRTQQKLTLENLRSNMTTSQKKLNDICSEQGSSNWLTCLPLGDQGFKLTKTEFRDALSLRYGWPIPKLPSICVCTKKFDVAHALTCKKGGFITQRHNEIRDMIAKLLSEVCKDVAKEPPLNEITGEHFSYKTANTSNESRLDISVRGFWATGQRAFFDVRIFDPLAQSYSSQELSQTYSKHEKEKKRSYNERVLNVENGTFTPLVFSAYGGMGRECSTFHKRLCEIIAEKRNKERSLVTSYIQNQNIVCFNQVPYSVFTRFKVSLHNSRST